MSWHRPRPFERLQVLSEEELLNRVINAKALLAICGRMTVTLHTPGGIFEITPEIAKKSLRMAKPPRRGKSGESSAFSIRLISKS